MQFITNPGVEARSLELLYALRRRGYSVRKEDSRYISSYLWVHGREGIIVIRISDHPRNCSTSLISRRPITFLDTSLLGWSDLTLLRYVKNHLSAPLAAVKNANYDRQGTISRSLGA
jgi:hypothetical protein